MGEEGHSVSSFSPLFHSGFSLSLCPSQLYLWEAGERYCFLHKWSCLFSCQSETGFLLFLSLFLIIDSVLSVFQVPDQLRDDRKHTKVYIHHTYDLLLCKRSHLTAHHPLLPNTRQNQDSTKLCMYIRKSTPNFFSPGPRKKKTQDKKRGGKIQLWWISEFMLEKTTWTIDCIKWTCQEVSEVLLGRVASRPSPFTVHILCPCKRWAIIWHLIFFFFIIEKSNYLDVNFVKICPVFCYIIRRKHCYF